MDKVLIFVQFYNYYEIGFSRTGLIVYSLGN